MRALVDNSPRRDTDAEVSTPHLETGAEVLSGDPVIDSALAVDPAVQNRCVCGVEFAFDSLENRVLNQSGVNLDEELANIVVFQNAYAASARVIQTTNELFDQLFSI